jgi:signal-transduction protein with cAMP-binding, CBS, and nucleotidyltransferase domain
MTHLAKRISELPLDHPARVGEDASLRDVARAMSQTASTFAMLGSQGLVTEHDLVTALARGMDVDGPARGAVSSAGVRIGISATLLEATLLMLERNVQFLIVFNTAGLEEGILCLSAATDLLLDVALPKQIWDLTW